MNWSRGLLRVWLVLAVLWYAAITVISGHETSRTYMHLRNTLYGLPVAPPAATSREKKNTQLLRNYLEQERRGGLESRGLAKLTEARRQHSDDYRRALVRYYTALTKEAWTRFQRDLLNFSLPPLAVLLIGVGAFWAARGFLRN